MDPQRLSFDELAQLLSADPRTLRKWIGEGLPWRSDSPKRKRFDAKRCYFDGPEASQWLLARGYCEPPPERRTARNVAELARWHDITVQRVYQWVQSGCPRELDGSFDLDAVEAWKASRDAENSNVIEAAQARAQSEAEISRIKAEDAALDLAKKKQRLIDFETPTKIYIRHIAEAMSHLAQVPGLAMSLSPARATEAEKRRMRDGVVRKIDTIRSVLERGLREWAAHLRDGGTIDELPEIKNGKP